MRADAEKAQRARQAFGERTQRIAAARARRVQLDTFQHSYANPATPDADASRAPRAQAWQDFVNFGLIGAPKSAHFAASY